MKKYIITTVVAVFAAFTTLNAGVITPAATAPKATITGSLDVSHASNYTFRGQVLDSNPVVNTKLTLRTPVTEEVSIVGSAEQAIGTKGSALFRSQYNAGVEVKFGRLTVTPGYEVFTFPNATSVPDSQIATLNMRFNDAGFILPNGLSPYIDIGKGVSGNTGTRAEVGVTPKLLSGKLDVTLPVAVGWSYNGYYPGQPLSNAKYAYSTAGVSGEYHVNERLSIKGLVAGYATDTKLGNKSNNFVTSNLGVAVSF